MKKIYLSLLVAMTTLAASAATEQNWYNDVTSITSGGEYYIYSVNGKGFMQGGNSKVKAVTPDNYSTESNLLFTIDTSNKRTYSGSNYLCSYEASTCGPVGKTNSGGSTMIWENKSSYWLVYGSYTFIWAQKAYLRYENNAYAATCINPDLDQSKFKWYLISPAQYDRHWAIYAFDSYKETLTDIPDFEGNVHKDVYAALVNAFNVSFVVTNADHSKDVVEAAQATLKANYEAAVAYPALFAAAETNFYTALTDASNVDQEDVPDAVFDMLHAYDDFDLNIVETYISDIEAATQALTDAYALAQDITAPYLAGLAAIDALEATTDMGDGDVTAVFDDIDAARIAIELATTVDEVNAAATLKTIDPITFAGLEFDALTDLSGIATAQSGLAVSFVSDDESVINADMQALHAGVVTITASTIGDETHYPFVRIAEITINAVNNEYDYVASICEDEIYSDENFADLTESDVYQTIYENRTGGDSLVVLTLTVNPKSEDTYLAELTQTEGDVIEWAGEDIELSVVGDTTLVDSLVNEFGCDSVVYQVVHVNAKPIIPTTVETVKYSVECEKVLREGQLYILRGKELYDVVGRKQ